MSEIRKGTRAGGRPGGRSARHALRAAVPERHERIVYPGIEGGQYLPLSESDVQRIHATALDVLEKIGISEAPDSGVALLTGAGCILGEDGRIRFPRALVEDVLARAARKFPLCAQDTEWDLEPWGDKVWFGTAGAAVNVPEYATRSYRDSTAKDLYNMARIVDTLDNIHFFQRTVVCRDIEDPSDMDFNTCYLAVAGTRKHVGTSWTQPSHVSDSLDMLHHIAGGENKWRARPFVSQSNCFVAPPLRFAPESCECLEIAVRGGMPVLLLSASQSGATAPASLAGTVAQACSEVMAGLVYVDSISPGHPAIIGMWPFVSDLRTGAMSGGSPEQALLTAACGQMGRFYDMSLGSPAGMTDSKIPDYQSGLEKGYTLSLAGLAGVNLVYETAGMYGSLLGCSIEGLILDNDAIGAVQRLMRGIRVDDEALSFETMKDVCLGGAGHYLGHSQTMDLMTRDYFYPETGDRRSPGEWEGSGSTLAVDSAIEQKNLILQSHFPNHIDNKVDADIRSKRNIYLSRSEMTGAKK